MFRRVLFPGFLLASLVSAIAAPPAWWASRGATDANPPDDFSAVNQGQLKQFTQKAMQELNDRIPGGAGPELNGLVNGWVQAYQTGGYNAANPLPADFDTMNSGQLKWIADKVHARLVDIKYEDAVPAWLVLNPTTDNQLVNLGQLKTVFNFDLTAPAGQLPGWWLKFYFDGQTGVDPEDDADGDGLTNVQELAYGSNPGNSDSDTNGVPDGWDDTDQDGYSDLEELAAGTDPRESASMPDGISTDTLLVRGTNTLQFMNATTPVTRIGARGSKDFAFRELKPPVPPSSGMAAPIPTFYLGQANVSKMRQEVDFHRTSILWGSGGVYPDITDLFAYTGANDVQSSSTLLWKRGTPDYPNNAPVPYLMESDDNYEVERSIVITSKPYGAGAPSTTRRSFRTGDPETEDFDFSIWTNGAEGNSTWDTYVTSNTISEDGPHLWESADSVSGYSSYAGDFATYRDSYTSNQISETTLTDEYTDGALTADVDQALADARAAASGGTSPGITGSAPINGRGIADHQWSDDHINHLKMDSLVSFSTTVSQTGVRKVVFLWTEILRPDPASPGGAAPVPSLKVHRVIKSNATPFPAGTTVTTGDVEVIHPAEPGYIDIPGPSSVDGPDQLQATQGSQTANPPHGPLKSLLVHSSLTDQGIPVTLEATGSQQIRLWRKLGESFSPVILPYTLGPEQKAGQTSRPAAFLIQGLASGNVRLALKAQGQEIAAKDIRVISFDLDTDSDNSGTVDATTAEDLIEFTESDPGVIISCNGGDDADTDGTPNRDDLDNAGEFVPVKFALANLLSSERAVFRYSAAGFGTQSVSGSLRLWKKNGTSARTGNDLILNGGQGYSASDLGASGGGSATLYLETVSDLGGAQTITVESPTASDAVKITPLTVESVSRDKYLAGSFETPAGWDDLTVGFVNTSSQENLGTYGNLTGSGATRIYDSVDRIMDEEDMLAGSQPATQKVWFIRNAGNPRKLDFYTCFNSIGTVEIRLARGGQTVFTRNHQLTAAEDFAKTIRYVNDWVKGVGFDFSGGGGTIPMAMGAPSANGFGDDAIEHLTRAALIPFFNVINQVEGLASAATGFFDGARAGINDDWKFLLLIKNGGVAAGGWAWQQAETELIKWRDDPLKRAGELKEMAARICKDWVFEPLEEKRRELSTWDGFKNESWKVWKSIQGTAATSCTVTRNAWKDIVKGLTDWGDDFCDRMMTGAEKAHWDAVPWTTKLDNDINEISRQASYTFGYTMGYLCEQVAVGALTAGTVKIAQVATKGGIHLAANLARRTAANVAARAHFLKRLLAEATKLPDDLVAAYQRGFSLASTGPTGEGMDKCAMYMMQEAADAGKLVWREYVDNIVGKTNIRQFVKQGGDHIIERQFSRLIHILGDEFTEQIGKNFLKVADEFLLVKQADGTVDDFFEGFFKAMEGNPSLIKHADDVSVKVGGTTEALSPGAKARLKQVIRDPVPGEPHPEIGNPWRLDDVEDWTIPSPIPSNYWARGNLIELWKFKKAYKAAGFKHHPNATGYDYSSAADDLFVQMKSYSNPDGATTAARDAINKLLAANTPAGSKLQLHIVHKNGTSSTSLKQGIEDYLNDQILFTDEDRARFLPTIFEEFSYP